MVRRWLLNCSFPVLCYPLRPQAANRQQLDYLVVHARHGQQRSRDPPHWARIGEVKAAADMPVFGNGDVKTHADLVVREREWTRGTHTGGGKAPAFKPTPNATRRTGPASAR